MIMQKKQRRLAVFVAAVIISLAACSIFATSATAEEKLPQSQIQLQWPVTAQEVVISSTFGERMHPVTQEKIMNEIICITGKDFDGEIVLAAADGIGRETGFDPKQGNYLLIDHASGMMLSYSPVSYTHLDVYKRQFNGRCTGQRLWRAGGHLCRNFTRSSYLPAPCAA